MEFTLLDVTFGLVFWSALTFFAVLFILKKYLWGPLIENLDLREKTIHDALAQADEAKNSAEKSLADYNRQLAEAREDVRNIIAQGKETAEKMKTDIIDEANERANGMIDRAKSEIEAEKEIALGQIREIAVDVSIAAAEKMLERNLSDADHARLIDDALKSVKNKS